MMPHPNAAMGITRTAVASEDCSEMRAMMSGVGTSPSRWIVRIDPAIAAARDTAGTSATITALIGLVEAKISSSAAINADQYSAGARTVSATAASFAASNIVTTESQRFPARVRAR